MPDVKLKVTCTGQGYRVRIDDEVVSFENDVSAPLVPLEAGVHGLTWHMWGNAGSGIAIEGFVGETKIFEMKERKIPANREKAWGVRNLEVKS